MAVWYCGSVQYAAVAQFAISHAYNVGDIVRQLAAPTAGNERCFRCTTAGTSGGSESAWTLTKGGTTTQGTAVFTEVTGNSTYNWAAPHARIANAVASGWPAAGDTIYVASNHSYSLGAQYIWTPIGTMAAPLNVICVNPAGSVPPVAADVTTGAAEASSTSNLVIQGGSLYVEGVTLTSGSGGNPALRGFGGPNVIKLKNCGLVIGNATSTRVVELGSADVCGIELINTTMTFGHTGQKIQLASGTVVWSNTASAVLGTVPTTLFSNLTNNQGTCQVSDVDLSAVGVGGTLAAATMNANVLSFTNCKLDASVTVASTPTSNRGSKVFVLASGSAGNSARNEIYDFNGTLTTETTVIRTGGATDGTTPVSWKVATSANPVLAFPMTVFPIAEWNATTGSARTATVEILNDGTTLTNADIWLEVEYLGTSGNPLASLISSGLATPLTTPTNVPTSAASWTTTGIGSPVTQYLQVSFTPQMTGLVRATVKIAKASKTIYIDPLVTLA